MLIRRALFQMSPRGPTETAEYPNINIHNARIGFDILGVEAGTFTPAEFRAGHVPLARDTIVVGGVVTVLSALQRLGVPLPEIIDYPECLWPLLHREVRLGTLQEVRRRYAEGPQEPWFIKPVDHKVFDGHLVGRFGDLGETAGMAPQTEIWISSVVKFETEYRYFVRNHRVVGVGHYRGDPLLTPDPNVVRSAVETYAPEAPAAYVLDFGVLSTGETALVEVNDGFAFGCYGLHPREHARMLEARWVQLTGLDKE